MAPKVLRRCSICKNFHASYLVVDPALGKGYYCYSCWKAWQAKHPELTLTVSGSDHPTDLSVGAEGKTGPDVKTSAP